MNMKEKAVTFSVLVRIARGNPRGGTKERGGFVFFVCLLAGLTTASPPFLASFGGLFVFFVPGG